MNYGKAASEVLTLIGGKDNIVSAAHCATRLRLVIADNGKCDKTALENVEGVKGVFEASGQLQIIFGTGIVNKVYDAFIELSKKFPERYVTIDASQSLENVIKDAYNAILERLGK